MSVSPVKRKKISLWFLILIVFFVIAIFFTLIHILNSSQATYDGKQAKNSSANTVESNYSISSTQYNNTTTSLDESDEDNVDMVTSFSNFYDIDSNSSDVIIIDNTTSTSDSDENTQIPEDITAKKILVLKNHKYIFDMDENVVLVDDNYIQVDNPSHIINLFADSYNFSDLKTKSGLKEFLQEKYNMQITSKIKAGSMGGSELIVFTVKEDSDVAYFFITPLNTSEVLCLKVYNSEDMSVLLKDISKPINEILSIKANVK